MAAIRKTYFSSYFRQRTGVTFCVCLQYERIQGALELLRALNWSITEIAYIVGFNEPSTFQKAFKRWTNLTPRDFETSPGPLPESPLGETCVATPRTPKFLCQDPPIGDKLSDG